MNQLMSQPTNSLQQQAQAALNQQNYAQTALLYEMLMEQEHDKYNETNQNRKKMESNLDKVRDKYNEKKSSLEEEQRKVNELQRERDNLKLKIFYMSNAKDDIRGDIAVIRRATEKAESDKSKLESEKQHQVCLNL
jgi:chromosome segregation ATPase